ncbi:MAG: DNA cytosine methyltransferase [Magnetococcales bacterium]|nr:DNA cytosine methyltransferase [Magnetococcales bacterium]
MTIDFFDFFSGCGGSSCGMQSAGLAVRFGLDIDPDARATFTSNFKDAVFLCDDIKNIHENQLNELIGKKRNNPILFGACAPCQPFSKQNRQRSCKDERRSLLSEFQRFVQKYQPEYVFIENVPGIQTVDEEVGPFADFLKLLSELEYYYNHRIVMACHYGVPQNRPRMVLMASRLGRIAIPERTHGPGTSNPDLPTVREWIGKLPAIAAGEIDDSIPNHRAARLSDLNMKRIKATPIEGGRSDWPLELRLNCHDNHRGHTDVYGRMHWDKPASTLTTRCISLSNGRFGHPEQHRAISVREAACLQTFPMDFVFHGNLNSMARQIGNAVPVRLAEVFGKAFLAHYHALSKAEAA